MHTFTNIYPTLIMLLNRCTVRGAFRQQKGKGPWTSEDVPQGVSQKTVRQGVREGDTEKLTYLPM